MLSKSSNYQIWMAGYGGFAQEVAAWLGTKAVTVQRYLVDNDPRFMPIDNYERTPGVQMIVAIADPKGRKSVVERLTERYAVFHTVTFNIGPATHSIGMGGITCPYSVVSNNAKIGMFCHLNLHATVGHDVTLGDFCTLSSHVDLCGNVQVGEGVFFGSGARVLPGVKIGAWARIGAGAVVVKDVPAGATIYAAPGRQL